MKKTLILYLCIIINFQTYSQSIKGIVEDENGNSLYGVTIINQTSRVGTATDASGEYMIFAKIGDVLRFSYIGKEENYYEIKSKDTGFLIVTLKEDLTQLKEFVVDGKSIKKVSALKNDNIIDYYSLGINTFLILKRVKRNYVISIEGFNKVYKTFTDINGKPNGLFYDFKNKFYIKFNDSIRQFDFNSDLKIIECIGISQFENHIYPMLFHNDSLIIKYSYKNHNKSYLITKIKRDTTILLFAYSDKNGIKNANRNYNEAIALYMETTPPADNIISNKLWDGDIGKLSVSLSNPENEEDYRKVMQLRKTLFQSVSYYDKISSKEIEISSFFLNNVILTFNFNNDSLTVQNINGDILHQTKLAIPNKGFTKEVVLDREQNTFYGYSVNDGVVTLDKLNLQTGTTTDSYELKGVTFPKNLKVIDGWAYFINPNKNGYHKLYRIALN